MAQFTMYAIWLANGRFVQLAHMGGGKYPPSPVQAGTSASYDAARHYSTETDARVARRNDGHGGEIVAVDDNNPATMRVVA